MAGRLQVRPEQKQIEAEAKELEKIRREMAKLYEARKKYNEKKVENEDVLKEFECLGEGSVVYKLVGPVLAKQDVKEAKQTVEKRVAYITKELTRIDKTMEEFEKQAKTKQEKMVAIYQKLQQEGFRRNRPGPPI
eukprot:TRINITY_DN6107_c0_g2_i10.p2 TRINITY_DN6107_c0_g2~~TRINITY_DN6107_c0_g2_i10.p2  ORF type:complete len:135 (+),score=73.58 TRINITY_DN6107_c0_g2_i10:138-542(+)